MKRVMMILGVSISLVTMVCAWPGQNYEVSTTPIRVLPEVNPAVSTAWTTTTAYVTGTYVYTHTNFSRMYYWALSNGTSGASAPSWSITNDVHDGSITWRYVNPVRKQITLENIVGTNRVAFGQGYLPVKDKGIVLPANGCYNEGYYGPCWQGEIKAVNGGGTNTISVDEKGE